MEVTEEQINRTIALQKYALSERDRNLLAPKVACGEVKVTLDEFKNGQVPVMIADLDTKEFKQQMRRFDINQMIAQKDAARKQMDDALVAYDLAKKNLESLTIFITKLEEARNAAVPARPE